MPHPLYSERGFVLAPAADLVNGGEASEQLRGEDEAVCGKVGQGLRG